jgi:hypothetical protein
MTFNQKYYPTKRRWTLANPEKTREYAMRYRAKFPEKYKEYQKKYREELKKLKQKQSQ